MSQRSRSHSVRNRNLYYEIFQDSEEKKSQENDSQMLIDSQEDVFRKISAVISQSSHSTNVGDLEESLLQAMDTGNNTNDKNSEELSSTYDLRSRSVSKHPKKKGGKIQALSKSPILSKTGNKRKIQVECFAFAYAEEEMEEYSQESVSMLRDCYQQTPKNNFPDLMEGCMNSELEVIDIYGDEEYQNESRCRCTTVKVESSTQTDFMVNDSPEITHPKEREIVKHAKFISSVVKLKTVVSSKKTILDKRLSTILQRAASVEDEESPMEIDQDVSRETADYVIRSSDVGNVFRKTVQILLQHLEDAIREDFLKTACYWKNSVNELVVEILSQAVDSETLAWKMVASFLYRIIESILNDEKSKNLTLESKTNFIISFIQSTRLSYSIVNSVIRQLNKLKTVQRPNDSTMATKVSSMYLIKNSYFLLRILKSSLEFLQSKSGEEKIENLLLKKPEGKNYNVLEMWKKHWNRSEPPKDEKTVHEWETTVSEWCEKLDEISLHCVNHIPVLSVVVHRCGELAKEILNVYHFNVIEENNC